MKKIILIVSAILLTFKVVSAYDIKENKNIKNKIDKNILVNQVSDNLKFINVGIKDGVIKTVVINNTSYTYNNIKFKMKVMNEFGEVLIEETSEIKESIKPYTTFDTNIKTNIDLNNASIIEYEVIK